MANVNINLPPRARFQLNAKQLSEHRDFVSTHEFQAAIDNALLQYQAELAQNCKDQYTAMAMGLRLLGAQELVQKIFELGITPEKVSLPSSPNLNHHV